MTVHVTALPLAAIATGAAQSERGASKRAPLAAAPASDRRAGARGPAQPVASPPAVAELRSRGADLDGPTA